MTALLLGEERWDADAWGSGEVGESVDGVDALLGGGSQDGHHAAAHRIDAEGGRAALIASTAWRTSLACPPPATSTRGTKVT